MKRALPVLCLLFALWSAAPASATDLTVAQSLAAADRYWGPHPCAGRAVVTFDPALRARGNNGEATGVTWNTSSPADWQLVSCDIAILPGLGSELTCVTIFHEVGHLVTGPEHVGRLDPSIVAPKECSPPVTRADLVRTIRKSLPARYRWRLSCTQGQKIRCVAKSSRGHRVRRFEGEWDTAAFSWTPIA